MDIHSRSSAEYSDGLGMNDNANRKGQPQRTKKLVSLRLHPATIERIDAALERAYSPLPPPSRTAILEQWILDGLLAMERKHNAPTASGETPGERAT